MKYNYTYTIKYQEVDDRRQLRLPTMVNYLLEVAGRTADELGFGIRKLHPEGLTWILSRLMLEMDKLPTYGEEMEIETWIEQNAHMLSTRDFRIYLHQGEERVQIGQAKSVWAVLDMEKREVVNIFEDPMFANSVDGEVLDIKRVRMTTIPEPTGTAEDKVHYSDLDYNRHCNSTKYIEKMLNAYLPEAIYEQQPIRLDINYQREVMAGEMLTTSYLVGEDGVQYQQRNRYDETNCTAKITFTK